VAIYFSSRARDWFGREEPAKYFQAFQGAHQAVVLEHIPWGVVLDENSTLERLKSFPVVLLPNVAILSDREVAMLRQYVEEGSALIVTGWTGLFGQRGDVLERSAIESLIGGRLIRRLESRDNHVRFTSQPGDTPESAAIHLDLEPDWPFLVEGPAVAYEPTSATPIGELLKPHRTVRQRQGKEGTDWPMSAGGKVGPGRAFERSWQRPRAHVCRLARRGHVGRAPDCRGAEVLVERGSRPPSSAPAADSGAGVCRGGGDRRPGLTAVPRSPHCLTHPHRRPHPRAETGTQLESITSCVPISTPPADNMSEGSAVPSVTTRRPSLTTAL